LFHGTPATVGRGVTIVSNADGTVACVRGVAVVQTSGPAQSAVTLLYTDNEIFYGTSIRRTTEFLTPALQANDDFVYATTVVPATKTLQPSKVTDADTIFAAAAAIPATRTLKPPPKVMDLDTVFAASASAGPVSIAPAVVVDSDAIAAADIGWHLYASPVVDSDTGYGIAGVKLYNLILPDVLEEEDTLEGYPFKIQTLGGVPVPPKPDVLTGWIGGPRRKLTGSIRTTVQLAGSLRPGARPGSARKSRH
jgi:hypothetical protein